MVAIARVAVNRVAASMPRAEVRGIARRIILQLSAGWVGARECEGEVGEFETCEASVAATTRSRRVATSTSWWLGRTSWMCRNPLGLTSGQF